MEDYEDDFEHVSDENEEGKSLFSNLIDNGIKQI